MEQGAFVISLDFELMWGIIDIASPEDYGKTNVGHVREVVHRMVELFEEYDVKATFATVGMLMVDNVDGIKKVMPSLFPSYNNNRLSPYENRYLDQIRDKDKRLYFAPDLIAYLQKSDNVEIGTHTFCHYYCYEEGQSIEQFEADLKTAIDVAHDRGITVNSIVFPRNQVSREYLTVCAKYGIESYRGNPDRFFAKPNSFWDSMRNKIGRFLDSYLNLGGRLSYSFDSINANERPINIKASRFFRPYLKKLYFLESLRINRIRKEIIYAAQHGEIYHLWWHPHNFGRDLIENFANLRKVLECFKMCSAQYGMKSMTMRDVTTIIKYRSR